MGDAHVEPFPGPDPIRFPNTRRRTSASGRDAQNGGSSSSRHASLDDNPQPTESDTCRICRSEGLPNEPLFYPCKCSGSIKYVHQDCLMEWLSHSQKKHCELCKTPFRFTKLYAADMPKALPFHIFASHMAKYLLNNILVWLRAAMVASVWLVWLPYLMRSVWHFLFWISDEGFPGSSSVFGKQSGTSRSSFNSISTLPYGPTVCPSSPLFAPTTTAATVGGILGRLPPDSIQLANAFYLNLTSTDYRLSITPLYSTIIRILFGTPLAAVHNATIAAEKSVLDTGGHPSLLSNVAFLQNLTRHPFLNQNIIHVIEGQIITVLVIVCFILIILVRDYVVQQQPEINMRAAFAAAENAPLPAPGEPPAIQHEEVHLGPVGEDPFEVGFDAEGTLPAVELEAEADAAFVDEDLPPEYDDIVSDTSAEPSSTRSQSLPPLEPPRDSSDSDTPLGELMDSDRITVQEYMAIYREAGADPHKILRIAKERNLENKLEYWLRLTQSMMDKDESADTAIPSSEHSGPAAESSSAAQHGTFDTEGPSGSQDSDQSSEWIWPDDPASSSTEESKGKGKALASNEEDEGTSMLVAGSLRPRANTDGPTVSTTIHPLANNNWSFTDLPQEPSPASPLLGDSVFRNASSQEQDFHASISGPSSPSPARAPFGGSSSEARAVFTNRSAATEDAPSDTQFGPHERVATEVAPRDTPDINTANQQNQPDAAPPHAQPAGLAGRLADFMFRDVDAIDPAELAAVGGLDDFDNDDAELAGAARAGDLGEDAERDREVVEAAVAAGLDPDAIEDAEDLEGILELLGMRGPVAGLFQNAVFCGFLVSLTVFVGIFVPYNIGRLTVWTVANPMRPARMLISFTAFLQDCVLLTTGLTLRSITSCGHMMSRFFHVYPLTGVMSGWSEQSWDLVMGAWNRILNNTMAELPLISASEMRNFSAISHEALIDLKGTIGSVFSQFGNALLYIFGGNYVSKASVAIGATLNTTTAVWTGLKGVPELVTNPQSWVINLTFPEAASTVDPELAYWGGADRFWAIICGYITVSFLAGLYLRRGTPFSSSQTAQDWEASFIDALNQASGVMKVILIIGIEMLVFPLYCGVLLDIALLPLFANTTLHSRLVFAANNPVTSIFVHWFVGTGYMFHFALFVSMCRKITRKGVLYFIRDPDDPEFHPVRDVLERNVTTQLRKIAFSALVYGALVIICLGGVVWGLSVSMTNVLPIHYSSNEPVLEFPIDLLFYNFLMPLAIKFFRPSDGLHAMYTWWFRKCARLLRMTWFLFGQRRVDEEGQLALPEISAYHEYPWWRKVFLELDKSGDVVPKTWRDVFDAGNAKPTTSISPNEMILLNARKHRLVLTGQLKPNGRFVRTPASDQVKIPKGREVFLEVNEHNTRADGSLDLPDTDLYASNQYQLVYIPPHFRVRIFLFILLIWVFAAVTGVGITIVPLIFGRRVFKLLIPDDIKTNDIYAFSIGLFILGSAAYALFHARPFYRATKAWVTLAARSAYRRETVRRVLGVVARVAKIGYAYFFLLVAFPLMVASLMELYALIPLHEFMYSVLLTGNKDPLAIANGVDAVASLNPRHTIRVVQGWTIGLLYLRLSAKAVTYWFPGTRLSAAVRAVLRRGWLDPDLAVLTRAFVVPGLALFFVAVASPLLFAKLTIANGMATAIMAASSGADIAPQLEPKLYDAYLVLIYRLSFPAMALIVGLGFVLWGMVGVFKGWKARIRDEAYLIGERLHNFGAGGGNGARGARVRSR